MEILTTIVSIVFLLGLILVPVLLFIGIKKWSRLKFSFLTYLILSLIITLGITWTFAWWTDTSDSLLLSYYGYDFEAMNETDRFNKVKSENLERVKELETANFGVGWPVKAIMGFVYYSPYLLIVYPIGQLIRTKRKNMPQELKWNKIRKIKQSS